MVKLFWAFTLLLSFSNFFGNAKEYKFCSKDTNELYSFTSESCPGGVFLKEPLSIDTSCYCHDSDVEVYNYCDLDKDTKSKSLVPHSPLGCQKNWAPPGTKKSRGYNKVRLILLKSEQTTPPTTAQCQLKCSSQAHTINTPGGNPSLIRPKPFYPQESIFDPKYPDHAEFLQKNNAGIEKIDSQGFFLDDRYGGVAKSGNPQKVHVKRIKDPSKDDPTDLELVPFRNRRTDEERLDLENPNAPFPFEKYPVEQWGDPDYLNPEQVAGNVETAVSHITPFLGKNNKKGEKYPVIDWMYHDEKAKGSEEGSARSGHRGQGAESTDESGSQPEPSLLTPEGITFPEFPDLKLTTEEEKFVYEIPTYLASISKHKKPAERNFFKLLKHVFRLFDGMVSSVLVEPNFLNDLYSIFYKLFGEIDESMQCNSLTDIRYRKIVSSLERCTPIPIVFMQKKDSCPPKLVKAVRNNETSEHCEISLNDPKYVLSEDKTFKFPEEDIVIGTVWKMIDSVVAMCADTFKQHGNMASLNYFVVAMEKLLMQDIIQEKWFVKVMNSEVYKGILLYEDYHLLATYMDQIDIGAHITGKKWTAYLKKPQKPLSPGPEPPTDQTLIPVGEGEIPLSRKRSLLHLYQRHRRQKRSPIVSQGKANIITPTKTKKQSSSSEYTWKIVPQAPINATFNLTKQGRKRPNGTNSGAGIGLNIGIQTIKTVSNYLIPVKNIDEMSAAAQVVNLVDNSVNEKASTEHFVKIAGGTTEIPLEIIQGGQNIEIDLNTILHGPQDEETMENPDDNSTDIIEYYYVSEEVDDEILGDDELITYEKHSIWGGKAYCLQTINASLAVSIDNVYPNVQKLCHKFNHKCQPPVSEQALLHTAVLDNCVANGWESIFLKSTLENQKDQIVVCCYDGRICTKNSPECKEKCKNYCLSIGSNPKSEIWMTDQEDEDTRCSCSTDPDVKQHFVDLLMDNLNAETNESSIIQNSGLLKAIPLLE